MEKVLMITYFFPPLGGSGVQRTLKFAKYLGEFGWQPVVLTKKQKQQWYKAYDETLAAEIPPHLEVFRAYSFEGLVSRCLRLGERLGGKRWAEKLQGLIAVPDFAVFAIPGLFLRARRIIKRDGIEIVFTSSPPPSIHLAGILLKLFSRVKWVADYRDPWTQNPYYRPVSGFHDQINHWLERKAHHFADGIVLINAGNQKRLVEKFGIPPEKTTVIPNGYDEQDFRDRDGFPPRFSNGKFNLVYTGSFYRDYTPEPLFLALKKLFSERPDLRTRFHFHLAGPLEGMIDQIRKMAKESGVEENLEFHGNLDHRDSLRLIAQADLLLLFSWSGIGEEACVPAKTYEYLRVGKPILGILPRGDCADLIEKSGKGYAVTPREIDSLKALILQQFEKWKRGDPTGGNNQELLRPYERKTLTRQIARVFAEVLGKPGK